MLKSTSFGNNYYNITIRLFYSSFDVVKNDTGRSRFSSFDDRLNVTGSFLSTFGRRDLDSLDTESSSEVGHSLSENVLLGEEKLSVDSAFVTDSSDAFLFRSRAESATK
jgi:hypothetical protein